MRRRRFWITLALAGACGILAGYLAIGYVRSQTALLERRADTAPAPHTIAVAARDLPRGTVVEEEDVRLVDWPADALPSGYAVSEAELIGRGVRRYVHANEPLLAADFADAREGAGLPVTIPEGMRAVSVPVDEVVGVAGFVLPGTLVDVIVTLTRGRTETVSQTLLQGVPTLAADQAMRRDEDGEPQAASVVTLLVTPGQAELLALAENQGRIRLSLRNTLDLSAVRTPGARIADLMSPAVDGGDGGGEESAAAAGPVQRGRSRTVIELIQGDSRSQIIF